MDGRVDWTGRSCGLYVLGTGVILDVTRESASGSASVSVDSELRKRRPYTVLGLCVGEKGGVRVYMCNTVVVVDVTGTELQGK